MNSKFPIVKQDGSEYQSLDELRKLLSNEPTGHYLLGKNQQWHGGIHISNTTAPWCVDKQPIRAIADGKVIAYRMGEKNLTIPNGYASATNPTELEYSNNFCLIEHHYEAENKEEGSNKGKKNALTFYSLYMHLAPMTSPDRSTLYSATYEISAEGGRRARDFSSRHYTENNFITLSKGCRFKIVMSKGEPKTVTASNEKGIDNTFTRVQILTGGQDANGVNAVDGSYVWMYLGKEGSNYQKATKQDVNYRVNERHKRVAWRGGALKYKGEGENQRVILANEPYIELNPGCILKPIDVPMLEVSEDFSLRRMQVVSGGVKSDEVDASNGRAVWVGWGSSYFDEVDVVQFSWLPENSDKVAVLTKEQQVEIKAGDPIGFLGKYQNARLHGEQTQHLVHLELFTLDENKSQLTALLNNTAGIKGETAGYEVPKGAILYQKTPIPVATVSVTSLTGRAAPTEEDGVLTAGDETFSLNNGDTFSFSSEEAKDVVFGAAGTMKAVEGTVLSPKDHKGKRAWFCIDKNYVTSTKANSLTPLSPEETVTTTTMTTDKKLTDINGDNWFKVENNRYVKESDGVEVSKYDLAKLGYRMMDDDNDTYNDDINYIGDMPIFFKELFKEIDTNSDGELSNEEIKKAYQTPEIRSQLEKLIVKNESEWHEGGRVQALYESFLNLFKTEEKRNVVNHEMTRIKELEFMSKVPNMGAEVWHMNPLSLVDSLKQPQFQFTLAIMKQIYTNFANTTSRDSDLQGIANELNAHLEFYKLDTPLRRCHFFAQILQETGANLNLAEFLNYRLSVLSTSTYSSSHRRTYTTAVTTAAGKTYPAGTRYINVHAYVTRGSNREFLKDDGGVVTNEDRRIVFNTMYGNRRGMHNGDYETNDGWNFRGRGLKQLTGRYNYTEFTIWHQQNQQLWPNDVVNFVNEPDTILQMKYAARSAVWFWLKSGRPLITSGPSVMAYERASKASNDAVNKVTDVVNRGTDSRQARIDNFWRLWNAKILHDN